MISPHKGQVETRTKDRPGRGALIVSGKVLVSSILLGFLLWRVPLSTVLAEERSELPFLLLIATLAVLLGVVLVALRWRILLGISGSQISFRKVLELTLIGHFFNQFLPTTIGGDAFRIWGAIRVGVPFGQATATIILDRLVGLIALLPLLLAGLLLLSDLVDLSRTSVLLVVAVIAGVAVGCLAVLLLDRVFRRTGESRIAVFASQISTTARQLFKMPRVAGQAFVLSFVIQGILIYLHSFTAQGLGADLTFLAAIAIVPMVSLIASLPISIAGWGVRESGLAAGFALIGLPADVAVITSILLGLGNLASCLPGGVIWLLYRRMV